MQTLSPPLKRLSRPDTLPPFRITDRDIAIVRADARFRFMTSDQVIRYLTAFDPATSADNVLRRLQSLFYYGYLDRPKSQRVQLSAFFDEGNPPLIYGLGQQGARLLAELGDPLDDRLDWTTKNKRATNPFLAHTLEVADAMLAFDAAQYGDVNVRLIDHHDLLPLMPEKTRESRDPFQLHVTVQPRDLPTDIKLKEPLEIAVVPDRLFSCQYADNTRQNFALELDRGTMDIKSKRVKGKSSWRRKLLGYFHSFRQGKHTAVWNFQRIRILTVTISEQRIQNMLAVQREVTNDTAAGLFLYTTSQRIAEHGPFAPIWISARGDGEQLLQKAV